MAIEKWAVMNNLKLNKGKSMEMIIYPSVRARASGPTITALPDIARVVGMTILGVYIDNTLSAKSHVDSVCHSAAQSL